MDTDTPGEKFLNFLLSDGLKKARQEFCNLLDTTRNPPFLKNKITSLLLGDFRNKF